MITMGQMNRMLGSGDAYVKAKDRDVVDFDIGFLADVHSETSYMSPSQTKPLRFMVFESYIMGGVGTYVIGEVLSGTLMPESNLTAVPGNLECHVGSRLHKVGFVEKDRQLVEKAQAPERVGVHLQNVKCRQVPRGTVLSEKYNTPAQDLDYAVGFFLTVNYKGELKSGMELYFVNNRISRKCHIKVESLIVMNSEVLIDKHEVHEIKSKEIAFLAIYPFEPLVLDDPYEFPEFGLVQLWDNCQTVAIGKLFKLFKKGEKRTPGQTGRSAFSKFTSPKAAGDAAKPNPFDKKTAFADIASAR